jgi:uncharacterized phage protein (TIGR01671 family)
MREIKFRAWDSEAGIMYPNVQNHIGNTGSAFGHLLKNKSISIMQYTGLKDKNGVEIFEGDIVRETSIESDKKAIGPIYFSEEGACWFVDYGKLGRYPIAARDYYGIEIIGNKHENPELLEAEQ